MVSGLSLAPLTALVRSARSLAALVHRPLTRDRAMALVRDRMARRDQMFLQMVRETIWAHPTNPYRRLLEWARWSPDRLAESVRHRGLDATLQVLLDDGVYLSYEEFKGRTPIQRDGLVLECTEADFDNPAVPHAFDFYTGGTRSQGSRVPASVESTTAQHAVAVRLILEGLGVWGRPVLIWMSRQAGFSWWLSLLHSGRPAVRWFSLSDLSAVRARAPSRELYALTQAIALTRGLQAPSIRFTPLSESDMVLDTVLRVRARHGACVVVTPVSAAARLAGLARGRGIALDHVGFLVGGEPLTPGKHQDIIGAGALAWPRYGISEFGVVGVPCARGTAIDDVHFLTDNFGLARRRRALPDGSAVDALMMTTLLPTSMKITLNVANDDFADVHERRCGCLWDELGVHTHLSSVRSFSKLTGWGVTVLGTDCVRIIEEVLPREFGGNSTDYQLLEAEDDDHRTRLYLLVSPSVGPIDEERVKARFIEAMHDPTRRRDLVPPLWRQADTIKVIQREPVSTATGKLLPFHTLAGVPASAGRLTSSTRRE